jgi:ribonuclease VapC
MVVDTSAILAIIFDEDDAAEISRKIAAADILNVSAATLVETSMVLSRRTRTRNDIDLQRFLDAVGPRIVPFDEEQFRIASEACARFGRGSGHPAGLNLGDCFSYALAHHLGMPLLFKGSDFARTDVPVA